MCSVLDGADIASFADSITVLKLGPHAPIFDEGEPAAHVFTVRAGTARIYKTMHDGRRQIVGFLVEGDLLGLTEAGQRQYVYSAEAVEDTELCRMKRRDLDALIEAFPQIERRLLGLAAAELAAAQDHMLLLGRKTARERMATFLLHLQTRSVRRGRTGNPIALPMSRADIADHLGLTTETVSRTITLMRQEQLISLLTGGFVQLDDAARLARIAEGY